MKEIKYTIIIIIIVQIVNYKEECRSVSNNSYFSYLCI